MRTHKVLAIVIGFILFVAVLSVMVIKLGIPPYSRVYQSVEVAVNKDCKCLGAVRRNEDTSSGGVSRDVCIGIPYRCEYQTLYGDRRTILEFYLWEVFRIHR